MLIVTEFPGQNALLVEAPGHLREHFENGRWELPYVRRASEVEVALQRPLTGPVFDPEVDRHGHPTDGRPSWRMFGGLRRYEVDWSITKAGGVAVTVLVAAWVGGIAIGDSDPGSWIGRVFNLPFGRFAYMWAVGVLFIAAGAVSDRFGRPFFRKAP